MFKKTIRFTDFNGVEVEKDFYFHLSKAELMAMAHEANSLQARIQRLIAAQDGRAILNEFREIIKEAVGVRSEDGSRFIKSDEAKSQLLDSPAFDELLMELSTNANASVEFISQLVPEKMRDEMLEQLKKQQDQPDPFKDPAQFSDPKDDRPAWMKELRKPTREELMNMPREELLQAFRNFPNLAGE